MGLLAVFGIGYYVWEQRRGAGEAEVSGGAGPVSAVSPKASPTGGRAAVMRAMPEEKVPAVAEVSTASVVVPEPVAPAPKPKPVLLADGKVRTVMASGETLVTGGYLNTEGKWEFSMVTATVLEVDGNKLLVLSPLVVALDDAGVSRAGLSSLLTGEVETRQHGEVWKAGEKERILKAVAGDKGTELMSSPTIMSRPGMEGTIQIGSEDGVMFQMGTKADLLPDGNLDLTVSHKRQAPGK